MLQVRMGGLGGLRVERGNLREEKKDEDSEERRMLLDQSCPAQKYMPSPELDQGRGYGSASRREWRHRHETHHVLNPFRANKSFFFNGEAPERVAFRLKLRWEVSSKVTSSRMERNVLRMAIRWDAKTLFGMDETRPWEQKIRLPL